MVGKNRFGGDGSNDNAADTEKSYGGRSASLREKEQWIGKQLRLVYQDALNDPVPDHLLNLLKKLDTDDPHKS